MNSDRQDNNGNGERELSLYALLGIAWNHRSFVVVVTVLFAIGSVIYALLATPIYEATVTMLPQGNSVNEGLLGTLASVSGGLLGGISTNEALYQEIVRSNILTDKILERKWDSLEFGREASLYEIFGLDDPDPEDRAQAHWVKTRIRKKLRRSVVFFHRDHLTGFMALKVKIPHDPVLAAEVANFLAVLLEKYNRNYRSSKAMAHRQFVESRLATVGSELQTAENALVDFKESNRGYSASPSLSLSHEKLERDVSVKSSVWIDLNRQLEAVSIDENAETVYINILDYATPGIRPSSPNRRLIAVVGTFLGFMLSVIALVLHANGRDWLARISRAGFRTAGGRS